ncbi:hypothetical protein [Azospirillum sp. ST 5-10]|uniref:hypothetical protein n=1 Tax=unclassified Azospirillum TaxID=2630922 RepID=UPI003F4A80F0
MATITDILFLEQDRIYAEHWSRPAGGAWGAAEHLMGPQAVVRLPWFGATLPLAAVYRRVLEEDAAAT